MRKPASSIQKGNALELRVRDLFESEISEDRFWAKKDNCRVFWKKGYHSKDRQDDIVFDVSIEIYLPGAKEYSSVVLIECKNYTHPVPVDDVEEFFTKVQQVAAANAKAVVVASSAFQSGARTFAKSKGIGLMRYFDAKDFKWELRRSPSAGARSTPADEIFHVEAGLSNQDFRSLSFDLYLQSPSRATNSLWDFFEDLVLESGLHTQQVRRIANPRSKLSNQVPFREKDELETQSIEVLANLGYVGGEIDLQELCARETKRSGLLVETNILPSESDKAAPVLGRIEFDPLAIKVYSSDTPNRGRDRFTLAHELAHYFLNHGRYLIKESCDDSDFQLQRSSTLDSSDVARMEYQANYFAASILMPRMYMLEDFRQLLRTLEIPDKGFGPLFVDDQPCNLQNFDLVTGRLMQKYGVSRTAVKIRLESLGLLRDVRGQSALRSIQNVLGAG